MRKALLISYRFPPQGGGGVQRTVKYTKYLRDYGWEPVVQTARDPYWPIRDESLLEDIPDDVRVYRTRTFEFERLENRLMELARRGAGPGRNGTAVTPDAGAKAPAGERAADAGAKAPAGERASGEGRLGALRRAIHRRLLIPDPQVAWFPGAMLHGTRIARREGVDLIYSSSPPNSIHLFAGSLARRLGLPWVADFRDPWTDGPRRRQSYENNAMRERIEVAAERWVAQNAARITVSAAPLRDRFLAKYDFLAPEHVEVLTNGFDPTDFVVDEEREPLLEPGRFHVVGTGNIEAMFDRRPLYRAIAELTAEDPALREDLRVTLVGAKKGPYQEDFDALGLDRWVRFVDWVPHTESVRYLQESDALLMCQLPHEGGGGEKLSGKSFEYLHMRKPVICLTVPGVSASMMQEGGTGHVIDPFDRAGIKQIFADLYRTRGQYPPANEDVVARFDRRRLTERLAGIFDRVVGDADRKAATDPTNGTNIVSNAERTDDTDTDQPGDADRRGAEVNS